jgi:hypothetical protein
MDLLADRLMGIVQRQRVVRLLRCKRTNRYFARKGWTEDLDSAMVFSDVMEAAQACVRHGLVDVELVVRANDGGGALFAAPVR